MESESLEKFVKYNHLLNDDCLAHIFEYLPVRDLIRFSGISKQFHRIAKETIRLKHPKIKLKEHFPFMSFIGCENFLQTFATDITGFSIDAISLDGDIREWRFLKLIINYLSQGSRLKELELENFFGTTLPVMNLLSPIFSNLTCLKLSRIALPITVPFLLKHWPNLEEVRISYCYQMDKRNRSQTRNLTDYPLNFRSKLKILELRRNSYIEILTLIQRLPQIFTNLEEVSIHPTLHSEPIELPLNFIETMVNITKVTTIKTMRMDLEFKDMNTILEETAQNLPNLQTLEITYAKYNNNCLNAFSRMKKLKNLHLLFIYGMKRQHVKPIVRGLTELNRLILHCRINMRTLLQLIRVGTKLTQLEVEMHSRQPLTKQIIDRIAVILTQQQKRKKLNIKIYNQNIASITTREMKIINDGNESPLFHITRWP